MLIRGQKTMEGEMMKKVRVGVIGTSGWTEMMFLASLGSHPGAVVAAICGRDGERAGEVARRHGIPGVYNDYRKLLAEAELDAVVVATPDDLHHEMTMAVLGKGLHVLCEKPLALTVAHAQEMYETAVAQAVVHMALFTWRWQPHFRYLRQLLEDGYIGRLRHAEFRFVGGFGLMGGESWRTDSRRANGVVSDLGAHMFDFARWYGGEVETVAAELDVLRQTDAPAPSNDDATVNLVYASGARALVRVSTMAYQADRLMELSVSLWGDAGRLEARQYFTGRESGATLLGARVGDDHFTTLQVPVPLRAGLTGDDMLNPYLTQAAGPRLFVEGVLANRPVTPDFHDGYQVQRLIAAALASGATGRRVPLADF